jgi:hypothetical protein
MIESSPENLSILFSLEVTLKLHLLFFSEPEANPVLEFLLFFLPYRTGHVAVAEPFPISYRVKLRPTQPVPHAQAHAQALLMLKLTDHVDHISGPQEPNFLRKTFSTTPQTSKYFNPARHFRDVSFVFIQHPS